MAIIETLVRYIYVSLWGEERSLHFTLMYDDFLDQIRLLHIHQR